MKTKLLFVALLFLAACTGTPPKPVIEQTPDSVNISKAKLIQRDKLIFGDTISAEYQVKYNYSSKKFERVLLGFDIYDTLNEVDSTVSYFETTQTKADRYRFYFDGYTWNTDFTYDAKIYLSMNIDVISENKWIYVGNLSLDEKTLYALERYIESLDGITAYSEQKEFTGTGNNTKLCGFQVAFCADSLNLIPFDINKNADIFLLQDKIKYFFLNL